MQNKSEKYSAVYSRFCLRARLSEAGARTRLYGNDFRRMSGAGERDKRERNGKSGLTPDKTKRPSVGGARLGPAPPLGPAGGGHDDAESAADRGADLAAAGGRARASIEQGPPEPGTEASRLGFFLKHQDSFRQEIGLRMATSLRTLGGQFLWQTASFTFRDCPREVLKDLPPPLKAIDQPLSLQFNADTMTDAAELARPFFTLVPSVCGLTKLITKPSSPAAQQAATVTALTLTWEKPKTRHSRPTLTVDMQFALSTEHGDLHPPKDANRRELALDPATEATWRRMILSDIKAHAEKGRALAAGYWRQMGNHKMAAQATLFEVEAITEERVEAGVRQLKVRWSGYHPSWEKFRLPGDGEAGDAVSTWEPASGLTKTDAYKAWEEQQDNARRQRQSERSLLAKAQELIAELEAENGDLRRENRELSSVVGKYEQRELAREKAATVKYQKMLSDRKLQRARDRLDNADTRAVRKCSAEEAGATNLETIGAGQAQRGPTKAGAQGPSRLCGVAERATTMALSVAYHLLITNALRRGDGVASIPTERRAERLFGDGPGRSKLVRRGIKLEHLGEDYSPEKDSVIAAMVRIVVARVRPAGDPEA
ncbi:hypothetical protein EMIHUDRAFT_240018 [Emiliania huxleyi CCMP1516]|uniref:Chromo domain-containing protein n=2 Tax=Emiliania huxleyi TaxID=2903 RepID=A0A0D3JGN6_EMIH1|nr:hypothetical protein EMIHUDRAFT_240018 [Emiliania huxleyi CCMP1516]EOD22671.1 hypothetical protein EMIHUDRAFT_240018 [Emiliania huxleyi CCMP1516]|eukprot:XP_005775100.1 hypothetical protein EMIHUDRAFT_240018 [Emiliania huxleyi CCMP1516]